MKTPEEHKREITLCQRALQDAVNHARSDGLKVEFGHHDGVAKIVSIWNEVSKEIRY